MRRLRARAPLSWDQKLAALNVFMDHAEANPGKIDFTLRCGNLPAAELARKNKFPEDVVQRMMRLTLLGIPDEIRDLGLNSISRHILTYI